jgi:hypothetical protein
MRVRTTNQRGHSIVNDDNVHHNRENMPYLPNNLTRRPPDGFCKLSHSVTVIILRLLSNGFPNIHSIRARIRERFVLKIEDSNLTDISVGWKVSSTCKIAHVCKGGGGGGEERRGDDEELV